MAGGIEDVAIIEIEDIGGMENGDEPTPLMLNAVAGFQAATPDELLLVLASSDEVKNAGSADTPTPEPPAEADGGNAPGAQPPDIYGKGSALGA